MTLVTETARDLATILPLSVVKACIAASARRGAWALAVPLWRGMVDNEAYRAGSNSSPLSNT